MVCAGVSSGAARCDPAIDPYCLGVTSEPAVSTWRLAWITEDDRAILEVPLAEWVALYDPNRPAARGGSAPGYAIPLVDQPAMAFSPSTLKSHPYVRVARRIEDGASRAAIVNPPDWRIVRVNGDETRQSFCSLAALFDYTSIGAPVLDCPRARDEHSPFDLAEGVWEETRMAFAFAGPRRNPVEFTRPSPRRDVVLEGPEAMKHSSPTDVSLAEAVAAHLGTDGFAAALPEAARKVTGWRLSGFQRQDILLRLAGASGRQPFVIVMAGYAGDSPHFDGGAGQWLLARHVAGAFSIVGAWPVDFGGPDKPMVPRDFLLAVDLDDDGTDELVTSSAAWESWTYEVYQWTDGAVRRLYASPARGI